MELSAVISKLKSIIETVTETPGLSSQLSDEADIINEVGLDSLQMIEFMLDIEESFSIELNFDEINFNHLASIKTLAEYLAVQIASN